MVNQPRSLSVFKRHAWMIIVGVVTLCSLLSTPLQLANAMQGEATYYNPRPGAKLVSPGTAISLRHRTPINPDHISPKQFDVQGSISGVHTGRAVIANDGVTVLFYPSRPFAHGETVVVRIGDTMRGADGRSLAGASYSFTISTAPAAPAVRLSAGIYTEEAQAAAVAPTGGAPLYRTVPADFPTITIGTASNQAAEGLLFMSNFARPAGARPYLLIIDDSGEPIYYRQGAAAADRMFDFKKQQGMLTYFDSTLSRFVALNNNYELIDTYQAGNGYPTDFHELQVLPNGHALLMIYDTQPYDLSPYGGPVDGLAVGLVIQELDTADNVVFEWRSWDHMPLTDSTEDLTVSPVDYVHGNAIELDTDGNLLISSRHLEEITKINRQTGAIIWRFGGKQNQFTLIGDGPFIHQHDIRRLPNGNVTLFDNGNGRIPAYSRGLEYQLDEVNKIATQVRVDRTTPDTNTPAAGNAQRLANGNTLLGWGITTTTTMTELRPDGSKALEMTIPGFSYRSFRFDWQGQPHTDPTVVTVAGPSSTQLYYSWNGATEVASYRVYGGESLASLQLLDSPLKAGFETSSTISGEENSFCFFRVVPIDAQGQVMRESRPVVKDDPACTGRLHEIFLISIIQPAGVSTSADASPH
jgi:Arylsulfotransferase (ASST)